MATLCCIPVFRALQLHVGSGFQKFEGMEFINSSVTPYLLLLRAPFYSSTLVLTSMRGEGGEDADVCRIISTPIGRIIVLSATFYEELDRRLKGGGRLSQATSVANRCSMRHPRNVQGTKYYSPTVKVRTFALISLKSSQLDQFLLGLVLPKTVPSWRCEKEVDDERREAMTPDQGF